MYVKRKAERQKGRRRGQGRVRYVVFIATANAYTRGEYRNWLVGVQRMDRF